MFVSSFFLFLMAIVFELLQYQVANFSQWSRNAELCVHQLKQKLQNVQRTNLSQNMWNRLHCPDMKEMVYWHILINLNRSNLWWTQKEKKKKKILLNIIKFDIIHHKSRGDPLRKKVKNYKQIKKDDFLSYFETHSKRKIQATNRLKRWDFYIEHELVTENLKK